MRVPRLRLAALAALMAGAPGAPRAEPATVIRPGLDASVASVSSGVDAPADPASVAVPDYRAPTAPMEPATPPPVAVAPQPPAEPQAAAVFARLGEAAPLLARTTARDRDALRAFYAGREYRPVWIADGAWTEAARSLSARLAAAGEDGLDARAYPVPMLSAKPDQRAVAEADLRLSAAAALYARDARGGRISPAAISRLITPSLDLPTADAVLRALDEAGPRAGEILLGYNPSTAGYRALKARLAALRGPAPAATAPLRLPPGPTLRIGMRDPRVPALRAHFGLEARAPGTLDRGPGEQDAYDAGVAAAVARFQRERALPGDGTLNVRTTLALADAGRPARASGDEAELIVNMERWRWLPADLGPDYVLVNVPEFRLRVFRGGAARDEARVIVGKTSSPTPLFSGMMEYAVVNPSWYVPPSILKTMAPRLAGYGGKTWGGYEVVRRGGHISLRQPPGERNALGFIKFMFPNQHAVYLHDTPNRSLFSAAHRAFSHGCVRVDDPFRFADAVLPNWTEERLKKLIGKGERTIRLPEKLPVHIAYFTAFVDDAGGFRTLPDLYGYDGPMRTALGLPGGGPAVAKLPAEPEARLVERPSRRHVADERPRRLRERPAEDAWVPVRQAPRRVERADGPPAFGEPGLWTPAPRSVPRSYW